METPFLDYSKEIVTEKQNMSDVDAIEEHIYHRYKAKIDEYKEHKIARVFYPIMLWFTGSFAVTYIFAFVSETWLKYIIPHWTDSLPTFDLIFCLFIATLCAITALFGEEFFVSKMQEWVRKYEFSHAKEQVEDDPFKNAIKTSYTYLDRYYDQTQQQAKSGFRITMGVALFGAGLICFGIWRLFSGDNETITPAYITCGSGVITEFISSIFFAMYNKTVTSMNSYHDKLVLSQNIAFALRVAGEMEGMGEKNKAKLAIINELVKDVNAQMMKSDADTDEPKKKSGDGETSSETGTPS